MNGETQEMAQQKPALWTKQFVTLTLASFLLFLNLQMLLSTFSMHIKGNLSGEDIHVSLATSMFAVTAIIARLMTGRWIKRWSKDQVLTVGLLIAAASTALASLPSTIMPLLLIRALYGIGFGIGSTVIPTLVSQIIPPKRMGEGIGYFGLSTSLAMSIGPATGMLVMKEFGFTTLATLGAGAVICMFPMLYISGTYLRSRKTKEHSKCLKLWLKSKKKPQTSRSKAPNDQSGVFLITFLRCLTPCFLLRIAAY